MNKYTLSVVELQYEFIILIVEGWEIVLQLFFEITVRRILPIKKTERVFEEIALRMPETRVRKFTQKQNNKRILVETHPRTIISFYESSRSI